MSNFTVKAVRTSEGIEQKKVHTADYVEIDRGPESTTVTGYSYDGAVACRFDVPNSEDNYVHGEQYREVYVENKYGKTTEIIRMAMSCVEARNAPLVPLNRPKVGWTASA